MQKFHNKYRILSSRWQNWDYASNAAYYVTICTRHHACYFGNIVLAPEKTMQYSELGSIAHQCWTDISTHFPFTDPDAFVVMPNHVHGILVINKPDVGSFDQSLLVHNGGITGVHNPMFYENLSRIIRWYKGRCSIEIHKSNDDFSWQPRFHDRVIRNHDEYNAICDYINSNVEKWESDDFL